MRQPGSVKGFFTQITESTINLNADNFNWIFKYQQ